MEVFAHVHIYRYLKKTISIALCKIAIVSSRFRGWLRKKI